MPYLLDFIFSNKALNELIAFDYDFSDDEIVDYFINFLKSCCLRIGAFPVEMFFNEKFTNFPLLRQTLRFHNHKESMVRTTVRNIYLGILKRK